MRSLSRSTLSRSVEPASPWRLNCFKPFLPLNRSSHPLLRESRSSSGIPTKSANCLHFCHKTSPVKRRLSLMAFETQRSIISSTPGCCVCRRRFTFLPLVPRLSANCFFNSGSILSQSEILGCFSFRLGYILSKCSAVLDWLRPFLWCHSRISTFCSNVSFSFFVNTGKTGFGAAGVVEVPPAFSGCDDFSGPSQLC